ncbi:MAG TPA: TonB-dependent receptor plug domain-containing protein, partial [Gelidibacter sp.]|uniref:TonB-dependent receptor plug domain-containing protein n=1 Tax=Gelidibacter sp. TaxID=2018083 RepID=UPI002C19CD09
MKTFIFLCCLTAFSFTPKEMLSQNAKIVIDMDKTVTVDEIFKIISDQTDYNFIYQEDLFKDFPKVQLKKGVIRANRLLEKSISNANIDFNFSDGNTIVIKQIKKVSQSTVGTAQEIQISGFIKDDNQMPIAGAAIIIKGTKRGAVSNFDGHYTVTAKPDDVLIISYLGYVTVEIPVNNQTNIDIQLNADTLGLDEVLINTGYYTVKDKERTGSISKVTAKEIGQQPVANPLAAMQGRMAGVNITQSSGTPGGGFDIQIRGRNSLRTEGNAPLYIVDGVPYPSQTMSQSEISSGVMPLGNVSPLNSINPHDIESIEVLKDADATAIYGSRGANGVVLITTKKGSGGKMQASL